MKHILIIDDDREAIELERDYLEISSYSVSVESYGSLGLKRVLEDRVDLVLLAVDLPDTDGFEICKQIRKNKDFPVLFVSGRKDEIDVVRGLGVGADDYIKKPFSPNELVARVKANLACYDRLLKKEKTGKDYIDYPGLHIDKNARRVYVEGKEKFFTTKEFDLLCFLASHPNHVYSKDDLFSAVWGMDSLGDIATVTVHIKKVRRKMGQTSARSGYIETVWGSGYRFRTLQQDKEDE